MQTWYNGFFLNKQKETTHEKKDQNINKSNAADTCGVSNRAFAQLLIAALERNIPADAAAMLRRGELPPQDVLLQCSLFVSLTYFEDFAQENERMRDLIAKESRATRRDIKASAKNAVTEMTTARMSEYEKSGPRSSAKRRQVQRVIEMLRTFKDNTSSMPADLRGKRPDRWIHFAAVQVWNATNGGYASCERLYQYCHNNIDRILSDAGL